MWKNLYESTVQKGKVLSVLNKTDLIFSQIPGLLVGAWRTRAANYQVLLSPWFLIDADAAQSLQPFVLTKEAQSRTEL